MVYVCTQKDPEVDSVNKRSYRGSAPRAISKHYLSTGFKKPHSGQPAKYCCLVINNFPDESALNIS